MDYFVIHVFKPDGQWTAHTDGDCFCSERGYGKTPRDAAIDLCQKCEPDLHFPDRVLCQNRQAARRRVDDFPSSVEAQTTGNCRTVTKLRGRAR